MLVWVPPMWGIKTHVGYINISKKRAVFFSVEVVCVFAETFRKTERNKKEKMQKALEAIQFSIKSSDQLVFVVRLS